MSVVIETTLGDITVDLFLSDRPRACLNFLKLCKIKYYNYNLFHTVSRGFMAQTGDPTGSRTGGESVFGILDGPLKRYFEAEAEPRIKHTKMGLISFVGNEEKMLGSQFFLTLGEDLTYLDEKHCVFGEVVEGFGILEIINEAICNSDDRPYQDIRITHTVILDDPYPDPKRLRVPERSPSPSAERLQGGRIAPDEEIDETSGKSAKEIAEMQAEREAKARATILEMVGDIPDVDIAPPENVLFVCKLNPVTTDDDLEIIFSRFGKIKSCEVIRDKKTAESLQYAFVEFEEPKSCEDAYFKMDNVLIDDRRIHVDFSQSVAKIKWHGKGRGVTHYDDKGRKRKDDRGFQMDQDRKRPDTNKNNGRTRYEDKPRKNRSRSRSPRRNREVSRRSSRSPRRSYPRRSPRRYQENHRRASPPKYYRRSPIRENSRRGNPNYNRPLDRYKNHSASESKQRDYRDDKTENERRDHTKDKSLKNRKSDETSVKRRKKDFSTDEKNSMVENKRKLSKKSDVKKKRDPSSDEESSKDEDKRKSSKSKKSDSTTNSKKKKKETSSDEESSTDEDERKARKTKRKAKQSLTQHEGDRDKRKVTKKAKKSSLSSSESESEEETKKLKRKKSVKTKKNLKKKKYSSSSSSSSSSSTSSDSS